MNRAALAVLMLVAVVLGACGGDDGDKAPARESTQQPAPASQTTTEAKPSGEEACGSISGGAGGGDSVENIKAKGVDCATAKAIARAVTIEGADSPPSGFECPDAQTYGADRQTCTRGSASVSWDVEFE